MLLARIEGAIVATAKDPHVSGRPLLLVRPQFLDGGTPPGCQGGSGTLVAVDTVGAGLDEWVIVCQGSSARLVAGLADSPVDAVIIGIVDMVTVRDHLAYRKP